MKKYIHREGMLSMKQILAATILVICFLLNGCSDQMSMFAEKPAPYTEDAYNKIDQASKNIKPPEITRETPEKEKLRILIDHNRKIFKLAGYDYDATLRKTADDLKNNPGKVRDKLNEQNKMNVAKMTMLTLALVREQCELAGINFLEYFDAKTAEAIKTIWNQIDEDLK
jgi:hypothetical protein